MALSQQLRTALKQKPMAIFGLGISGRGVRALAERMGFEVTIFDEKELPGTRQEFSSGDAYQHALVVLSPGFQEDHPWVILARGAGLQVMGELDFGGMFLSRGVYGVTGSDGKTTTTEFLAHTLNLVGQNAAAVGNNGTSLCAWLADNLENEPTTRLVVEISSFQASELKHLNLEGLLWTNFAPNHLDIHGSLERYFAAKWRLTNLLTRQLLVVGQSVFDYAVSTGLELPPYALVVPASGNSPLDTLPAGTPFEAAPFDEDFRLCVAFGERIGIPRILFHQAASTFRLPAHRLTKIAELGGVSFFNDAKSSTPQATLGALKRFDSPVLWIGGGKNKGIDIKAFAKEMAPRLKAAYLIGATSGELSKALAKHNVPTTSFANLENAVKTAFVEATRGDVILFSPGFSSLDQFENFTQRGNLFEKVVLMLLSRHDAHTRI